MAVPVRTLDRQRLSSSDHVGRRRRRIQAKWPWTSCTVMGQEEKQASYELWETQSCFKILLRWWYDPQGSWKEVCLQVCLQSEKPSWIQCRRIEQTSHGSCRVGSGTMFYFNSSYINLVQHAKVDLGGGGGVLGSHAACLVTKKCICFI